MYSGRPKTGCSKSKYSTYVCPKSGRNLHLDFVHFLIIFASLGGFAI